MHPVLDKYPLTDHWAGLPDNPNADIPQVLYQRYIEAIKRDPCVWCTRKGGTRDHIVPRASGGSDAWWNIAGACPKCNSKRQHTPLLLWMLRLHTREEVVHARLELAEHYPDRGGSYPFQILGEGTPIQLSA
jgi:5-methylcytosine-specific restriction endonuclease McrA